MAYTGILLRGDTFNIIYNDAPIAREMAMAGEHIGVGTTTGVNYWLNTAELAKIGKITDDQGNFQPGIHTTDLQIYFDGPGYIRKESGYMLVDGAFKFYLAALNNITQADDSTLIIENTSIDVASLYFITSYRPTIDALSTTAITVSYTLGDRVYVYNETTKTDLGEIATSGATLTFASAQTAGDVITVYALDSRYNHSSKAKGVI